MTFVVENHHYYAWCRDCPYTGPLRFKRELAISDVADHLVDKHGMKENYEAERAADVETVETWHPTPRPDGLPAPIGDRAHKPSAGEVLGRRRGGAA
jgi:hypothetical protein